jgi:hypothetical protein
MNLQHNFEYKGLEFDIDAIAFDMSEGCLREIKELFFLEGRFSPIVKWHSTLQPDWPAQHQNLFKFWKNNYTVEGYSVEDTLNDVNIKTLQDNLIVAHMDNQQIFIDFAGKKTEINLKMPNVAYPFQYEDKASVMYIFNLVCYYATAIRGQPLLTVHQHFDYKTNDMEIWSTLNCPIHNPDGKVLFFVSSTVSSL